MIPSQTRIRKILAEKNASVFWLPNQESSGQPGTRYLSGFTGSDSHILITKNKSYFITDGRYLVEAKKHIKGFTVLDTSKQRISELLKRILPRGNTQSVLIDGSVTLFSSVSSLRQKFPKVKIENDDQLLAKLRCVKTAEELTLLRKSARISCTAFTKLLPYIKEGVTEKWLAKKLTDILLECGSEGVAFELNVASGKNTALPHSNPSDKKLHKGELVLIDFGAVYKGYVSDMTRTVALGKISPKLEAIYKAVQTAQQAGCESIKAGVPASTVDKLCREILAKQGFDKYFSYATGHGIGLEVHELPVLSPSSGEILQNKEVVTCEPGVHIEGVGGVRIEDSLIVTKKGSENLTSSVEKKLIVL